MKCHGRVGREVTRERVIKNDMDDWLDRSNSAESNDQRRKQSRRPTDEQMWHTHDRVFGTSTLPPGSLTIVAHRPHRVGPAPVPRRATTVASLTDGFDSIVARASMLSAVAVVAHSDVSACRSHDHGLSSPDGDPPRTESHPLVEWWFKLINWITTGVDPAVWVAVHRKHHVYSDVEVGPGKRDPHSPWLEGFWHIQLGNVWYYIVELRKHPETLYDLRSRRSEQTRLVGPSPLPARLVGAPLRKSLLWSIFGVKSS